MNVEAVRDAYSSLADLYISLFGTTRQVHADDLDLIGRHLADRPGTVLDLGCGPGHLTAYLRSLGADAAGIDMVPEFVAHARAEYPDGDYRLGSLRDLEAADGSVGGILAYYSLIHFPPSEIDGALAELRRVSAPGAVLVVGFFDSTSDSDKTSAFDHKVATAYRWPVDEFSARLAAAGFTEIERQQRPAEGTVRPHAALAAVAS